MLERAILVRAMLLALLASACAGVALVFVPNAPWAGQVAGTAGIVVAACGLLLFHGSRGEGDRLTMAQRAWVVYVTVPAMVAIGLVWFTLPSPAVGQRIVLALGTWVCYGLASFLVALPGLRGRSGDESERLNPASRRILIGCAGAGFVVAMLGHQAAGPDEVYPSLFVVWLYVVLMLHAGIGAASARALPAEGSRGARTKAERTTGTVGVCFAAASFLAWTGVLVEIFRPVLEVQSGSRLGEPGRPLMTVAVALGSVAVTIALWSPLQVMRLVGWAKAVHVLATVTTGILGLMATLAAQGFMVDTVGGDLFAQVMLALGILDACTLIAVAVAVRMSRRGRGSAAFVLPIESMRVRCPRCQAGMEFRPGENACASCGLVMVIGFRDDRCPACEYDLRAVAAGSACPECGRARQMA